MCPHLLSASALTDLSCKARFSHLVPSIPLWSGPDLLHHSSYRLCRSNEGSESSCDIPLSLPEEDLSCHICEEKFSPLYFQRLQEGPYRATLAHPSRSLTASNTGMSN